MKNFYLPVAIIFIMMVSPLTAQIYNDGPVRIEVRVRDIQVTNTPTDLGFFGVVGQPDEYTFKLWARDNANVDGLDWIGGTSYEQDFDPPGFTQDYNTTFFDVTYPSATVPQFLDILLEAWEDDLGSDQLLGVACQGSRANYEENLCCGGTLFGACLGVITSDELYCDPATPFLTGLDYRLGAAGAWYDHGYLNGSCTATSGYLPRIETRWSIIDPTIYVDENALGTNDGSSWANAYTDVQDALAQAAIDGIDNDIFIAEGTYLPTATTDRDISFEVTGGTTIYGGFSPSNGAIDLGTRDFTAYPTILSGDIGVLGTTTDNSDTVILISSTTGSIIFDGLAIRDGSDYDFANTDASAIMIDNAFAGIDLTLNNCTVSNNVSNLDDIIRANGANHTLTINNSFITNNQTNDGAILNIGPDNDIAITNTTIANNSSYFSVLFNGSDDVVIENCIFDANYGELTGAIYSFNGNPITVTNTIFRNNIGGPIGGGIIFIIDNTPARLENVLFHDNLGSGGAIYFDNPSPLNRTLDIIGCTITQNSQPSGNSIFVANGPINPVTLNITNTIIWDYNNTNGSPNIFIQDPSTATENYNYSLISGYDLTGSNGLDGTNLANDPLFTNPATNDFTLQAISPVIDLGDNTATTQATDLNGDTRIIDGDNNGSVLIDFGAFEAIAIDTTPPTITCPANENVDFDSSCQFELLDYTGLATVMDAVDPSPTVTQSPAPGTLITVATTITLTATDASGNSNSCTFDIIPADNTPPSLSCPSDQTEDLDANCEVLLPDYTPLAFVIDNCDANPTLSQSPTPGTPITVATLVTIFAEDIDGNIDSCVFFVFPEDNTPPMIACPPTQNEAVDASCFFTLPDYTSLATASDNCGSVSITQTPAPGTIVSEGTIIITLEATDGSNTNSCTFDIIVEDTTPPTALCQDITVQLDATGSVVVDAASIDNGSSDNCSIASISVSPNTFTCAEVGTPQTVTLTVTDLAGNASTCTAIVTVEDNIPPVASCVDINVTLDASGSATIVAGDIDGGSTDNCGIASLTASQTVFTCDDIGANSVTLTVTDVNGNTSSCVALVTVSEDILPEAICQDITVQLDATGVVTITPMEVDGGSTDNCAIDTLALDIDTFTCSDVGPNMVTLTVTDTAGNSASCMAIVTVEDTIAPEAICQDITVQLDLMGMATITAADVDGGSTDACGIDSLTIDIDTFDCSMIGPNNVTLTVLDVNGNESSCVAVVTIEEIDTLPIAVCQNVTAPIGPDGTVTILPSSVDGGSIGAFCSGSLSLDRDTFTCEDIGKPISVVLTITNASGATDSCTALVNVVDTTAPSISCPEDQEVTENIPYLLPDYVALGLVTAEDFCAPFTEITQDPIAGTPMEVGEYLINFTATDPSGNTDTCFFRLTVNDVLGVPTQNSLASISLFPNPADNYITIENPKATNLQHVTIYDMTGRVVLKEKLTKLTTTNIDITNLASASYLVIIATENKQLTKQLVKE